MNLDRNLLFSWIEEDNIQKAYFRVHPLLTAEGDARAEAEQLWPSEGCLRIVPDRNELHTFKNRMRALGHYCVVDLRGLPADAGKIRTNKNFRPDKGEPNQFILYSDTVKALPAHSFYHIVEGAAAEFAAACEKAITPRFYIREGDTLFGPVDRETPAQPGNAPEAAGTLFDVACPDGVSRLILCMDDAPAPVARPAAARTAPNAVKAAPPEQPAPTAEEAVPAETAPAAAVHGESADEAVAEKPAAPAADVSQAEASAPADEAKPAETADESASAPAAEAPAAPAPEAPVPQEPAPKAADTPLPIGQRLEILDKNKDFKETLQTLDKPVSHTANLLNHRESRIQSLQVTAKQAPQGATQLVKTPLRTSTPQPKNRVQELASGHYIGNYEPPTGDLPAGASLRAVQNPVETACAALRQAWHASDSHPQLVDCILSLDGFRPKLEARLCRNGGTTLMQKLLRDRLQDLEAERLTALCELDRARRDTDAYRDEIVAALKTRLNREAGQLQKDRDAAQSHVDALKSEINGLTAQRDALTARVEELQQDILPGVAARLLADAQMLSPTFGAALRMSPVAGQLVPVDALIARLMEVCEQSRVSMDRNRAVALLTLLAISPRFGVVCPTVAPLATLAGNTAAAFGWTSAFAHQVTPEQRPLVTARPVDSTPAILMTSLPQYAPLAGVSKVLVSRNVPGMVRNAAYDADPWPVMTLPALPFVEDLCAPENAEPVSAASLAALLEGAGADADAIRAALEPVLKAAPPLSGRARKDMFRFISACAPLMEGGLAVAADWAILLWIVPSIDRSGRQCVAVKAALDEYPLSLAAL